MDNNTTLIRKAKKEDIERMMDITLRSFGKEFGTEYLLEKKYGLIGGKSWKEWLKLRTEGRFASNLEHTLVTEIEGKVAGLIVYSLDKEKKIGHIDWTAVDPEYRGRGIGIKQVEKVKEIFRQEGMLYAAVGVTDFASQVPAQRMYEKSGFQTLRKLRQMFLRL